MKIKTLVLATLAGLFVTACIPSLNPFYTAKDVLFEPGLEGQWRARDASNEPQHWRFEATEDRAYRLTLTDDEGKRGEFKATLFELKGHRFLDLIPTECEYATNQVDLVAFAIFPGHLLVHVAQIEPDLKMAFCNFDWLEDHLKEHPAAVPHHREGERTILTGTPKQLQRFVLKHVDGGELFEDYGELARVPGPEK